MFKMNVVSKRDSQKVEKYINELTDKLNTLRIKNQKELEKEKLGFLNLTPDSHNIFNGPLNTIEVGSAIGAVIGGLVGGPGGVVIGGAIGTATAGSARLIGKIGYKVTKEAFALYSSNQIDKAAMIHETLQANKLNNRSQIKAWVRQEVSKKHSEFLSARDPNYLVSVNEAVRNIKYHLRNGDTFNEQPISEVSPSLVQKPPVDRSPVSTKDSVPRSQHSTNPLGFFSNSLNTRSQPATESPLSEGYESRLAIAIQRSLDDLPLIEQANRVVIEEINEDNYKAGLRASLGS